MGKACDAISSELQRWLEQQHVFFVATAPSAPGGFVNCSPKGMDTFRILGPRQVAYVDLTGSGIETVAHLRDNQRIVFMFCAFAGTPKVVRLHGRGSVLEPGTVEFEGLRRHFRDHLGTRAIIMADVTRVSDSCGFAVPRYEYVGDRDTLAQWAERKGSDGLARYREQKNARSLDGLPGLPCATQDS